jgi:hypothetical protein
MAVTTPDWLAKHGGALREANAGPYWLVLLDGEPQYRLTPIPAAGKYSCQVTQTVNGRRLDSGATYLSREEAIQAGLQELRKSLGW